jgi:hypothetical protein
VRSGGGAGGGIRIAGLSASLAGRGQEPRGWSGNLPVVIVPGFCSSGLEVRHSTVNPSWEGERVWFSLGKLSRNLSRPRGSKGGGAGGAGAGVRKDTLSVTMHGASNLRPGGALRTACILTAVPTATTLALCCMRSWPRGWLGERLIAAGRLYVRATDSHGLCDPYVLLDLLAADGTKLRGSRKSKTMHKTLEPEWEQGFVLGSECEISDAVVLRVYVKDSQHHFGSDTVGIVDVDLRGGGEPSSAAEEWRHLDHAELVLHDKCTFTPMAQQAPATKRQLEQLELRGTVELSLEFCPAVSTPRSGVERLKSQPLIEAALDEGQSLPTTQLSEVVWSVARALFSC